MYARRRSRCVRERVERENTSGRVSRSRAKAFFKECSIIRTRKSERSSSIRWDNRILTSRPPFIFSSRPSLRESFFPRFPVWTLTWASSRAAYIYLSTFITPLSVILQYPPFNAPLYYTSASTSTSFETIAHVYASGLIDRSFLTYSSANNKIYYIVNLREKYDFNIDPVLHYFVTWLKKVWKFQLRLQKRNIRNDNQYQRTNDTCITRTTILNVQFFESALSL